MLIRKAVLETRCYTGPNKKEAVEIVRILVNANADVNAEDRFGKSPLTRAKEGGNSQIIKILEDAGATE